jgi:hypothetical protein
MPRCPQIPLVTVPDDIGREKQASLARQLSAARQAFKFTTCQQ